MIKKGRESVLVATGRTVVEIETAETTTEDKMAIERETGTTTAKTWITRETEIVGMATVVEGGGTTTERGVVLEVEKGGRVAGQEGVAIGDRVSGYQSALKLELM